MNDTITHELITKSLDSFVSLFTAYLVSTHANQIKIIELVGNLHKPDTTPELKQNIRNSLIEVLKLPFGEPSA